MSIPQVNYQINVQQQCPANASIFVKFSNVFHYVSDVAGAADSYKNIVQNFASNVWQPVQNVQGSTVGLPVFTIRNLNDATDPGAIWLNSQLDTPVTASALSTALADSALAVYFSAPMNTRGRGKTSKKFISGLVQAHVNENELSSTGQSAWSGIAAALSLDLTGSPLINMYTPAVLVAGQSQLAVNPTTVVFQSFDAYKMSNVLSIVRKHREKQI